MRVAKERRAYITAAAMDRRYDGTNNLVFDNLGLTAFAFVFSRCAYQVSRHWRSKAGHSSPARVHRSLAPIRRDSLVL